ncbi:MAG: hypothetical protein NVSMB65_00790 [Chloroflexota bacterium]
MTQEGPRQSADGEKRLLKLLSEHARRTSGTGFGFHLGGQEHIRRRALALVCRMDTVEPKRIASCVDAGVDAVELNSALATPATLEKIEASLPVPWGVAVRGGSFDAWQESLANGAVPVAEWITFTMNDDARFLELAGIVKVLEVDLNVRPEVLRGVAVSGADVVVAVKSGDETGGPLTVADVVRLRLLCDVVKQPVLIAATLLSHDAVGLRLARDSGAVGLLLETGEIDAVRALSTALDQMGDEPSARGAAR